MSRGHALDPPGVVSDSERGSVASWIDLYWIPLGAGAHIVRINGEIYEAWTALVQRRPRRALYHSALVMSLGGDRFTVEMTPVPAGPGQTRGVVVGGPVGARALGRFRVFRYEVRRWHDGVIPDLAYARSSPVRVTDDDVIARRVFDLLPSVPPLVWGRDEQRAGEMWSCNSIISWVLARAGVDVHAIDLPPGARAPGWDAGLVIARRDPRGDRNSRETLTCRPSASRTAAVTMSAWIPRSTPTTTTTSAASTATSRD